MVWTICCINVVTIAVAFKKRMILYALLNAIFLFIVTGQAFQIEMDLDRAHTVMYLENFISDVGFALALRYVLGISCVLLAFALFSRGYRPCKQPDARYSFAPNRTFYVLLFFYLCLVSVILIFGVIGLSDFLNSSRPGFQTGSTVFLVLLSVGLMPMFFKIIYSGRIGMGDVTCLLVSFLVTGAIGRISAGFYLLMILLALYYARGWADAPLTARLIAKVLAFGFAAVAIFIGYGAIRGAQGFVGGSIGDLIDFVMEHPEKSVLSLEWNYRFDIEGMSGIAGAFSQSLSNPTLARHDLGASWMLQGLIQWWPGVLKPYAVGVSDLTTALNWYPYSIVATGVESFYMSFGWYGIFVFPAAVYLQAWILPLWFQRSQFSPAATLVAYVLMTWTILFVRGPLAAWIALCFTYSLIPLLFWPFFHRHFTKSTL